MSVWIVPICVWSILILLSAFAGGMFHMDKQIRKHGLPERRKGERRKSKDQPHE